MFTLGYRWRPWRGDQALADGPSILQYVRDVAQEYGVDQLIRYGHQVIRAAWDSATARWTVDVETPDGRSAISAGFLLGCTGYYDYDGRYAPELPGPGGLRAAGRAPAALARGPRLRRQAGRRDRQRRDRGDAGAGDGRRRTPGTSRCCSARRRTSSRLPGRDPSRSGCAAAARADRPTRSCGGRASCSRVASYQLSRRRPDVLRGFIRKNTVKAAARRTIDVDMHFKPTYDPWDQRLCLVPDGDLFRAVREGTASTSSPTPSRPSPRPASGWARATSSSADIVVTATGLNLKPFGGDRRSASTARRSSLRDHGLQGADAQRRPQLRLHDRLHQRVLDAEGRPGRRVRRAGCSATSTSTATGSSSPVPDPAVGERPFMDFSSGYVLRALEHAAEAGRPRAVAARQNYFHDVRTIRRARDRRRRADVSAEPDRHRLGTTGGHGTQDKAENKAEDSRARARSRPARRPATCPGGRGQGRPARKVKTPASTSRTPPRTSRTA